MKKVTAATVLIGLFLAAPAHGEAQKTRAKAKATVEFFVPLLLDDSSRNPTVSDCQRLTADTWTCALRWTQQPDSAVTLTCRTIVIDEPEWVYIDEPRTRCSEKRTATRGKGFPISHSRPRSGSARRQYRGTVSRRVVAAGRPPR